MESKKEGSTSRSSCPSILLRAWKCGTYQGKYRIRTSSSLATIQWSRSHSCICLQAQHVTTCSQVIFSSARKTQTEKYCLRQNF